MTAEVSDLAAHRAALTTPATAGPVCGPAAPSVEDVRALLEEYHIVCALSDLAEVLTSRALMRYQRAHLDELTGTGEAAVADLAWAQWIASVRQVTQLHTEVKAARAAYYTALDAHTGRRSPTRP